MSGTGVRHRHGCSGKNSADTLWQVMEKQWGAYSSVHRWFRSRDKDARRWRGRTRAFLDWVMPPVTINKPAEAKKTVVHTGAKYKAPWRQRMKESLGNFGASVKKILRKVQT